MNYFYLTIAIVCEVIATAALQASEGFTKLLPSAAVVVGYGIAFFFLSLALRTIPVGIAYAVWAGAGVVLIALVGFLVFRQALDIAAMLGIAHDSGRRRDYESVLGKCKPLSERASTTNSVVRVYQPAQRNSVPEIPTVDEAGCRDSTFWCGMGWGFRRLLRKMPSPSSIVLTWRPWPIPPCSPTRQTRTGNSAARAANT
jgi:small multidrug resistance pump